MNTADQLKQIPDLAAEVLLTWDAKNPTDTPLTRACRPEPPVPADLETIDCLRLDEHGLLFRLTQCVRATAEQLRDTGQEWPTLTNPPTWASECAWLIETAGTWANDEWLAEYVSDEVAEVYHTLSHAARVQPTPALPCLVDGCHAIIHPRGQDGSLWLWPDVCPNNHLIDRREIARRAKEATPMTIRELAEETRRPKRTLQRWVKDGWLKPVRRNPDRYALIDAKHLNKLTNSTRIT